MSIPRARLLLVVLLAALLALAGCGGGDVSWRDVRLTLPDGWQELERRDTLLMLADGPPASEPGEPGTLAAAVQFTVEPSASIDDWRAFVAEQGGRVEAENDDLRLGSVPAASIQFSYVTNGIPTRERVVVVPSRDLVILQQPVPVRGQTDAPEVYLDRVDEFDAILDSIDFGAPQDYLGE